MKKMFLMAGIMFLLAAAGFAQKAEILYFKAELPCCRAKACNNVEADIKGIIESNYKNGNVVVKTIKLADENNAELVKKYNARSQTVVLLVNKGKKTTVVEEDISSIVMGYTRSGDKAAFETALLEKINGLMK